jgi:tRNA(fMet)-specific endonuclease VapC
MHILDTDHLSIFDQDTVEGFNLGRRLAALPEEEVFVTIITYEEQMRGWLAYVARANTPAKQIEAYTKLRRHIERFRRIPILDYDEKSAAVYERLRQMRIRVGTKDLQIAAIAIANDAILLTRNLSDFSKIPDLNVEDWSV